MPGLVGIVSLNGDRINPNLITQMRQAIQHQAWYHVDDYINPDQTVAISRVHLGVINQSQQPYSGRIDQVSIFLHGEIYNDEAIHCDPLEFIYHLYKQKGPDFAAYLNGSFIIVIIDKDLVLIANDRLAAKPLFYFNDGRAIYFGPEMKSLFLTPSLKRKLNQAALADFLANGQFTREHTLIENLETIDKATVLKITRQGVTRHTYWEYELEQGEKDLGWDYYQETLAGLLRQAVSRRLRAKGTYGILLSGGYDSRCILGRYLEDQAGRELHTVSWGRDESIPNSDCAIAKSLAEQLGADHGYYKLTAEEVVDNFRNFVQLGEGLTWFPESYEVFHRIREQQNVNIMLRGDECFGFSQWLLVHDEHTMFRALGLTTLQNIVPYKRILKPAYHKLLSELDMETRGYVSATCQAKNIHNRKDFFYLNVRLKYYLNPLNYVKNFATESFTPLLDYDLLDFVSLLPGKYRLGKTLYRKTVVKMFPALLRDIAQHHNMIDWATSFKNSPMLKQFIYKELTEQPGMLSEFINVTSLKHELDAFFAVSIDPSESKKTKTNALELLKATPTAYGLAHKASYYARKWTGRTRDNLSPERLIIRLLILKVWGDIFLNYPVMKPSV